MDSGLARESGLKNLNLPTHNEIFSLNKFIILFINENRKKLN